MSTAAPQAETTALVTPWMALCGVCRWMWMVKADQTNWLQLNGRVLPLIEDNTISCPSSTPKFKLGVVTFGVKVFAGAGKSNDDPSRVALLGTGSPAYQLGQSIVDNRPRLRIRAAVL